MTTLDDVRRIALSLPEAEERLTWDTDITFRVRDKIFAIGGEGSTGISIKASLESQAELVEMDPATFAPSAYVGRFGWITADLERVDPALLESLLREAWRRTAPKKLAATLTPDHGV
ncbi:MAG: MmcQ/YjbR family DNA-binding protein [Chloroflexi bacterium]|nr:MAG: MmcQ/YjbR family DNA-binding protein [Chloroflexota bacterium]